MGAQEKKALLKELIETGKAKGKVSILMYVLTVLFVLKYIFL